MNRNVVAAILVMIHAAFTMLNTVMFVCVSQFHIAWALVWILFLGCFESTTIMFLDFNGEMQILDDFMAKMPRYPI